MPSRGSLAIAWTAFLDHAAHQGMRIATPRPKFGHRAGLTAGLLPFLESDISGAFAPHSHSLNASADYQVAAHDVMSSSLLVSKRDLTRDNNNAYRELDAARTLTARTWASSPRP